jgi:hypothetical protein
MKKSLRKGWVVHKIITESGMDFISDNIFHIEQSCLYKSLGKEIRSVEFIRIKDENLMFIEAKTSFPNPDNPSEENKMRFQNEVDEICEKFTHSLNMLSSISLGVAENKFHDDFILPEKTSIVFVLVIKDHEFKWCKPIKNKIEEILPHYLTKIWKPLVFVINHEVAIKRNLAIKAEER